MNKPYNIQNANICNGIFPISFFKAALLINEGEMESGRTGIGAKRLTGTTGLGAKRPDSTNLSWIVIEMSFVSLFYILFNL
jgi:hypothetical protein